MRASSRVSTCFVAAYVASAMTPTVASVIQYFNTSYVMRSIACAQRAQWSPFGRRDGGHNDGSCCGKSQRWFLGCWRTLWWRGGCNRHSTMMMVTADGRACACTLARLAMAVKVGKYGKHFLNDTSVCSACSLEDLRVS
jgi:hypothetical protein